VNLENFLLSQESWKMRLGRIFCELDLKLIKNGELGMSDEKSMVSDSYNLDFENVYKDVKNTLEEARSKAYSAVNFYMVQAYWQIGRLIVEAQGGKERAEYGEQFIKKLSNELTIEFGKGFTSTNIKTMRKFYLLFQNSHALRDQLSWTHYRLIIKVDNEKKRDFYIDECIKSNWSTRQLERQINSFYFERLLGTIKKITSPFASLFSIMLRRQIDLIGLL